MKKATMAMVSTLLLFGCNSNDTASYREYYNNNVKELSSTEYCGRNNYNNGDIKAAKYIIDQLRSMGIAPMPNRLQDSAVTAYPEHKSEIRPGTLGRWSGEDSKYTSYLQNFTFPLNVMRGQMEVRIDGKTLTPTTDYIVKEFSPTCKGQFSVALLDTAYYNSPEAFVGKLNSGEYKDAFVLLDWKLFLQKELYDTPFDVYRKCIAPLDKVGGLVLRQEEQFPYFKARSYYNSKVPVIMVNSSFPAEAKSMEVNIESSMIPDHDAHNIIAYLPGRSGGDDCITFIAHYDHLGLMGAENLFPGANDNASGVSMLLTLAKYYSTNLPDNNIQFIFLDAEESNLLGAFYYAENPYEPLTKIKYMVNLDMIGDNGNNLICERSHEGAGGLDLLKKINGKQKNPFSSIDCGELTDNSDHYAFALKHVPVLYLTVEGDMYKHYHTPRDRYDNTSDANFERLFNLLVEMEKQL